MIKELEFYEKLGATMEGIDRPFFLIGIISEFANRMQTKGDVFFEEISWKQCFLLICMNMMITPPTIGELAEVAGSSHQNVKQMLLKLSRLGFVTLTDDPHDRRKQRAAMTDKAIAFLKKYDQPSKEFVEQLFDGITPEQLEVTVLTLLKLDANLHKI